MEEVKICKITFSKSDLRAWNSVGHADSASAFSLVQTPVRWNQGLCHHPRDHGRAACRRSHERGYQRRLAGDGPAVAPGSEYAAEVAQPPCLTWPPHSEVRFLFPPWIQCPNRTNSCSWLRMQLLCSFKCRRAILLPVILVYALHPTYHCGFASVSCSYANLCCGLNIAISGLRFSARFSITLGGESRVEWSTDQCCTF